MRTTVVTVVRGRIPHLHNQLAAMARIATPPDRHIVVAIDDDDVARAVPTHDRRTDVIAYHCAEPGLPMAAARNLGAQAAIEGGAELLIFLDVDCIPAPDMVVAYRNAAERAEHRQALLCGPVTYLPPAGAAGYDLAALPDAIDPHPARPAPADSEILFSTAYSLFWSLSFAVTTPTWLRIGGFCTQYIGYGAEDTDFAQAAAALGITMRWVGGAHAFHQYHPVSDPPIEHLHDIVTNAAVFHRRWGWWPMQGWLDAFEAQGLITRGAGGRPCLR